jgi:3-hydroxyisobutyrate dehydrogenase-like beta-hydroxyacid dehydrogenase
VKGPVGIIGLGIMGGAISANLVKNGWHVIGFDIDPASSKSAAQAGVEIASGIADLAGRAEILLTSLPNPQALADTVRAIADAGVARRIVCETSTLALQDKIQAAGFLEKAGHVLLDCPLSGTGAQAKTRDLVVYASGDPGSVEAARALFGDFSRQAYDLGVFGNGTRMKFIANLLVAIHNVAAAEAMVLAMKAGLDPHMVVEVIGAGAGTSRMFEMRAPMMADGRYEPATMRNSTWKKDMAIIGEFAAGLDCPTPLFEVSDSLYAAARAQGHGERDTAAICAVLEAMAGISRRTVG